jgi:hypothetical protein
MLALPRPLSKNAPLRTPDLSNLDDVAVKHACLDLDATPHTTIGGILAVSRLKRGCTREGRWSGSDGSCTLSGVRDSCAREVGEPARAVNHEIGSVDGFACSAMRWV